MKNIALSKNIALLVLISSSLAGCITSGIEYHRQPTETPAADNAEAIQKQAALQAAAQEAAKIEHNSEEAPPRLTAADAPSARTYDPWGRLNRFTYRFNTRFDRIVFVPVANGYTYLPSPVRTGIHNFFSNLTEVVSTVNYTLQGRLGRGVRSVERFVINSTVGIGGLFDFATKWNLPGAPTGFGTTLAKWGMHPGPYLVIPLLGPSSLRGGVGYLGDYGIDYGINLFGLYQGNVSYGLDVVDAVDQRSNIDFRYYQTGSPFEYENIRFLYVRKLLIEDAGLHRKDPPKKREPDSPAGE